MRRGYKLSGLAWDVLRAYLLDHEAGIATGENDYGDLWDVFIEVLDRDPVEQPNKQEE